MAWTVLTVVTQAGHKKRWSVLAAAGLRGLVRLLHVRAGFCCGVIRAHKKAIATLCFSPTHETHLFSKTLFPHPVLPQLRVLQAWPPRWAPCALADSLTGCGGKQLRLCGQLTGLHVRLYSRPALCPWDFAMGWPLSSCPWCGLITSGPPCVVTPRGDVCAGAWQDAATWCQHITWGVREEDRDCRSLGLPVS